MRLHINDLLLALAFMCLLGFLGNIMYSMRDTRAVVYAVITK